MNYVSLSHLFHTLDLSAVFRIFIITIVGFWLARFSSDLTHKLFRRIGRIRYQILVSRIVFYTVFSLFVCSALIEMGFNLHILLGAAGIFTVAIGLASQMSFSNFISGLFLMGEGAINLGDTIAIDGTSGDVVSIDFLSIKLKTPENACIRIPNEILIKTQISNLSRYPIRRLDLTLNIAYKENIEHVRKVLLSILENNSLCLKKPFPEVVVTNFNDSAVELRFSIWVNKENYKDLKNQIYEKVKLAFEQANIEIPYPQRVLSILENRDQNEKTTETNLSKRL